MSRSEPPPAADRRRGAAWLLGGAILAAAAIFWMVAPTPRPTRERAAENTTAPVAPLADPPPPTPSPAPNTATGWRSAPGRNLATTPHPLSAVPISWTQRIRTNGWFEPEKLRGNSEYLASLKRHQRIRALLQSPARETAECQAIIALTERRQLSLAAVSDLYNALWEIRTMERRLQSSDNTAQREGMESIGLTELEDFMHRFHRDHGVEPGPVFDELLRLDLHPTVFFGIPNPGVTPGEALLAD